MAKAKGIELSWIVVKDLKAAIKYYTEVVGLTLHTKAEEFGWAELSGESGAALGLAQAPSTEGCCGVPIGGNAIITVAVDNIEKTCAEMKSQGARLIGEITEVPGHVKMQTVRDPDGNIFQVVQTL